MSFRPHNTAILRAVDLESFRAGIHTTVLEQVEALVADQAPFEGLRIALGALPRLALDALDSFPAVQHRALRTVFEALVVGDE